MIAPSLSPHSFPVSWLFVQCHGKSLRVWMVLLPLSTELPFPPSEPPGQGPSSLRGVAGAAQGPGSTIAAGGRKTTGVLVMCLWWVGSSFAAAGSHQSVCGRCAEAKPQLPSLPPACPSAATGP